MPAYYVKLCKVCGKMEAVRTTATRGKKRVMRGYWCNVHGMSWYVE